jgi:hypothetical protein
LSGSRPFDPAHLSFGDPYDFLNEGGPLAQIKDSPSHLGNWRSIENKQQRPWSSF